MTTPSEEAELQAFLDNAPRLDKSFGAILIGTYVALV